MMHSMGLWLTVHKVKNKPINRCRYKSRNVAKYGTLKLTFSDFQEWLQKQEPITKSFLKWKTNQYDTRNFIPSYLKDYVDSTVTDKVFN